MPFVRDLEHTYDRFGIYVDQLRITMAKYGVEGSGWRSYRKLLQVLKNPKARHEISEILKVVAAHDGGKAGAAVIGLVLAMAIGGVGLAAMGSAVGIPASFIAALGGLGGWLVGNELDGSRWTQRILNKVRLGADRALLSTVDDYRLEGQGSQGTDPVEGELLPKADDREGSNFQSPTRAIARVEEELRELRSFLGAQNGRIEAAIARFESNQKDIATAQTSIRSEFSLKLEQARVQQSSDLKNHTERFLSLQESMIAIRHDIQNSSEGTGNTLSLLGKRLTTVWYMTWAIATLVIGTVYFDWFMRGGGVYRH